MTSFNRISLYLTCLTLFLAGCSVQQTPPTVPAASQETAKLPAENKGSFEPDTLYSLLVAEMAATRGMPRVTLHNYLQEAEKTRDLAVIKRSAQIAAQLRNHEGMLKSALLWIDLEPDNPAPHRLAATELIQRGDRDRAIPMLQKVLTGDDLRTIDALANRAQKMSADERRAYLELLDQLLSESPKAPLIYAKAVLTQHEGDLEQALLLSQQALELDPGLDRAILLEADLQSRTGHLDTALGHLREELGQRDHKQMRTLYTRLLLEKQQFPLAEQQADLLADRFPGDHNLHFYLGALMLEHNRLDNSERYFNRLADQLGTSSTLHYYLGRIGQRRGNRELALEHYLQVTDSSYLLASYSEITKVLDQPEDRAQLATIYRKARQQYEASSAMLFALEAAWLIDRDFNDHALELFDQALTQHPKNVRLRYNRAMLGEKMGNLGLLETDLRYLLELEPGNATALNALGYSLTDNTDRHEEALELIRKALAIKPDDPAILDSMGWAYYNLGKYQQAMSYLVQAYESFPDPEIATHLGKVYWALGQPQDAMRIWHDALERTPDSQLLKDAINEAKGPASQGI